MVLNSAQNKLFSCK